MRIIDRSEMVFYPTGYPCPVARPPKIREFWPSYHNVAFAVEYDPDKFTKQQVRDVIVHEAWSRRER